MFDVGERIKALRQKSGLTVNGLANKAGISQSYLREIELGNKKPTVEYLEYICDALHVSLVSFFDVDSDSDRAVEAKLRGLNDRQREALIRLIDEII